MSMKDHLPSADMQKLALVLQIKEAYKSGQLNLQEARRELKEKVVSLRPYEIALAEQELKTLDEEECRKEDIQSMMDLFHEVMDTSRPTDLSDDHPIMCYYRENDAIRKVLIEVEKLAPYPVIKNQWLELYDQLATFRTHLSRKQNQLYSVLEKKGFDRPTTTMWLLDDFIRDEIRDARKLLEEDRDDEFIAMQKTIVADVRDLMQKEETVLYPTSLAMINADEFEDMKSGDKEIGFALISVGEQPKKEQSTKANATTDSAAAPSGDFLKDLANLLGKHGYGANASASPNELLEVATGRMTLEQINLVYKHMPVDITYVDENELVLFYTDTEHRVFPRSKNVVGRDVKNCHPRTSVHLVEEIIEKFRTGEQDSVDFWINKPGFFIYIYYVAVRDEEGRFRGVLEMMQDCTRIRSLEGSRTLLTWSKGTEEATKNNTTTRPPMAPQPEVEHIAPAEDKDNDTQEEATRYDGAPITKETRLKELIATYPCLRDDLGTLNPAFKLLKTPLARIMIPKATVGMMAERSGMPLEELVPAIEKLIASY